MDDSNNNDIIFFKLWRNKVINILIFNYSRLYIKNKRIEFDNLESLRLYSEREYIETLVYTGIGTLLKGDLPEYCVLKELVLSNCLSISNGNVIPFGVEIIQFSFNYSEEDEIQVSELPISIHTLIRVKLKKPYINNEIPTNITSLSFNRYTDPIEFYNIKLPLSILKLNLEHFYFCHKELPIAPPSFIPSSVKDLTIWYNEEYILNLPIIPSTITNLNLSISGNIDKGLIPFGVKVLRIEGVVKLNTYCLPESITKLLILCCINQQQMENSEKGIVQTTLIPSGVTDLRIRFRDYPTSFNNIFPSSLTSLTLDKFVDSLNPPPTISELPLSLKYLKIDNKEIDI